MITEDYVSFETAKLLKKKGFDERCRTFWKKWDGEIMLCPCCSGHVFEFCCNSMLEEYNDDSELNVAAPTLQMAIKWLREREWFICIIPLAFYCGEKAVEFGYNIWADDNHEIDEFSTPVFNTYEEACNAAIKYCLENL